jgi:hypothetical protein
MNRLPQGASEPWWGKVGPHFLTNSERPVRSKYEDLGTWRMCHRTIESASFGNLPISVRRQQSTWKEQETRPNCEPATPSNLWSVFRLAPTRLRTTAQLDFSWPQVVCNSSKNQAEGGGGQQSGAAPDIWRKYVKMSFFEVMSEVQRFGRRFCRKRYFFKVN